MESGKKTIICLLVLFLIGIPVSEICHAEIKVAREKPVTEHTPSYRKSPEQKILVETISKKKSKHWLWVAGLAALAVGVAAGGGGGDSSGDKDSSEDKTNIKVEW